MNKKSLSKQFIALFIIIALCTILVSGMVTYQNQTKLYQDQCISNLKMITDHITGLINNEGSEFSDLKEWFKEHPDQVKIPLEFREDLPRSEKAFISYMIKHYDGRSPLSSNLTFDEMDDEAKRLYAIYRFEYWFTAFFDAVDEFDLSYVYFVFPIEGEDHTVSYMFDPSLTMNKDADGKEYIMLGDEVFEDPAIHKYMWEAWETGKAPEGIDSLDNEYGYVYTYCRPLIINGNKIGLICADTSVHRINAAITSSVIKQMTATTLIFILATIALYLFLSKLILKRIVLLKDYIAEYADSKNPDISESILQSKGQDDELGLLSEDFSSMITSLKEYMENLQIVTAEKERIGAELNVATQIQADMLPSIFPYLPERKEFDLYATMEPAKEVGGDFYDFFMVDDDHLCLVIADVSGKGVPAALFMVIAKTLIKNHALMGEDPSTILSNVNEQLCEGNEAGLFVTVWIAVIDLNTGEGLAANAGHEHPAIRKKDNAFELIKTKHSPVVAAIEGMSYRQHEFHLDKGDVLFVYTDGIPEAMNADQVLFGEERMVMALNKNDLDRPEEILPSVRAEIDIFVGDAPQFDDITMLAVRYNGKEA